MVPFSRYKLLKSIFNTPVKDSNSLNETTRMDQLLQAPGAATVHFQLNVMLNYDHHPSIRKISLSGCGFPWEYMKVIGGLVNLQVLKFRWYAFCGPEWKINEDEDEDKEQYFPCLDYLLLQDLDIERWVDEGSHFWELRHLVVRHCYNLKHFPREFEFIGSLEMIEVDDCSPSTVLSVQGIKERRQASASDPFFMGG